MGHASLAAYALVREEDRFPTLAKFLRYVQIEERRAESRRPSLDQPEVTDGEARANRARLVAVMRDAVKRVPDEPEPVRPERKKAGNG